MWTKFHHWQYQQELSTIPDLGCSEAGRLYSMKTAQFWNCLALKQLGWGGLDKQATVSQLLCHSSAHRRQLHFALVRLLCSSVKTSAGETKSSVETESVTQQDREADLYRGKFPPLVPKWSIFIQMITSNP